MERGSPTAIRFRNAEWGVPSLQSSVHSRGRASRLHSYLRCLRNLLLNLDSGSLFMRWVQGLILRPLFFCEFHFEIGQRFLESLVGHGEYLDGEDAGVFCRVNADGGNRNTGRHLYD